MKLALRVDRESARNIEVEFGFISGLNVCFPLCKLTKGVGFFFFFFKKSLLNS